MFGKITEALRAIHSDLAAVVVAVNRLPESLQEARGDPTEYLGLSDRLTDLEGAMEGIIGRAAGLVTEAESKYHAARAAEERSRGMMKRAERLQAELNGGDEGGEEPIDLWLEQLHEGDAEGGAAEGMPPLRDPLADRLTGKAAAARAKWGG